MANKPVYGYEMADPVTYELLKDFAAKNRNKPTEAETILWEYLKSNRQGFHFRRQHHWTVHSRLRMPKTQAGC